MAKRNYRKKTPGLYKRGEIWHIRKRVFGREITGSTETSNLEEAEAILNKRIEEARKGAAFGVRPTRTFKQAAQKYLIDFADNRSIADDASRIKNLLPYIGNLPLDKIYDETLEPFIKARLTTVKPKTVNNDLEIVRRILNLAARKWRDKDTGLTWLHTPPMLTMQDLTGKQRVPYAINWKEQRFLLRELPPHLVLMTLFKVNTGMREHEVCSLRWSWEYEVPELGTSVFVVPGQHVKNKLDRLIVLNRVAKSVVDSQRGKHKSRVFTYKNHPIKEMGNSAWNKARVRAAKAYAQAEGEDVSWGFEHLRVHDLKHTFGRRLRAMGVPIETRKVLLGHKDNDITAHYSPAEILELLEAANRVASAPKSHKSLTLINLRKTG